MTENTLTRKRWIKTTHNLYVFTVNGVPYGLDINCIKEIKEIDSPDEVTPVPHTSRAVMGYINVRGEIYQVLSLGKLLQDREETVSNNGLIIYLKNSAGVDSGAYTESIREIISVEDNNIDLWENDRPPQGDSPAEYITCGICRHEGEVIHLLSADRLCEAATFE